MPPPPDDPAWVHVTVNELSRRELADRGIAATAVLNCFDTEASPGERGATRRAGSVSATIELVVLQPTRAIPRKNVPGGIELAALDRSHVLAPRAGRGRLRARARAPARRFSGASAPGVSRRRSADSMADAYAACDVVVDAVFLGGLRQSRPWSRPSTDGRFRSGRTLSAPSSLPSASGGSGSACLTQSLADWLRHPDGALLEGNLEVARRCFSLADLPRRINRLMDRAGWASGDASLGATERARYARIRDVLAPGTGRLRPPTPLARRLPADQRREQLLDVALRLFAGRGFAPTTMDDIASAAGVTKPLLYQHFDSKRALYLELVDSVARDMLVAINEATSAASGPRQQVEAGFAAYFELVVTHQDAFRLLFGSDVPDDPELSQRLRRVEDTVAEAVGPLIDAGLDSEHRRLIAYAVVGMATGASRHWLASGWANLRHAERDRGTSTGGARGRAPREKGRRSGLGRSPLGSPGLNRQPVAITRPNEAGASGR